MEFERPFQATKPSAASLFSERSKLKLDLARRLIKPQLNVDENDFDVTTVSYSAKSKLREAPTTSESRNIEKTTKASKPSDARIAHRGLISGSMQKEKSGPRGRWKIVEARKSAKDRNPDVTPRSLVAKKIRVSSEKTITSSPAEGRSTKSVTEFNAIPRGISMSHRGTVSAEETAATTVDTTKIRFPMSQSATALREETSTLAATTGAVDENVIVTNLEPMKLDKVSTETMKSTTDEARDIYDVQREAAIVSGITSTMDTLTESTVRIHTTEYVQEITLSPTVTMPISSTYSSFTAATATKPEKLYPVYIPNAKNRDPSMNTGKEKTTSDASRNSFRARYTKQEQSDKVAISMVTSRTVGPTSRYIRKKSGVFTPYDTVPKVVSTEATPTQTKRREYRPRTATYRRHSDIPTSLVQPTTGSTTSTAIGGETASVTITPKPTKYHASVKSPTPSTRSLPAEPFVSVRIDTSNDTTPRGPGIVDSSNGDTGNSNIFNPTKSAFLATGNTTVLLERLRSTVAPLLNNLGNRTPVFSGAYSNVDTGVSKRT